jgi:predicted nuclease with RNAse H fold
MDKNQHMASDQIPAIGPIVAVGIDVAEERKGLDLVALDANRRIVTSKGHLSIDDSVRLVLELDPAGVFIDSPSGWSLSGKARAAERELRSLGIQAFATPVDPGPHPFYKWMRAGFSIYERLSPRYELYREGAVKGAAAEVFPHASAVLLAGRLAGADESKTRFRRGILETHGVDSAALPNIDRVDAALAALTGLLALEGQFTSVGDPGEGVIVVPVARLPEHRLVRGEGESGEPAPTPSRKRTEGDPQSCLCGCGAVVSRRFKPGHDAKLKSRLTKRHRLGDSDATTQLVELGWLEPQDQVMTEMLRSLLLMIGPLLNSGWVLTELGNSSSGRLVSAMASMEREIQSLDIEIFNDNLYDVYSYASDYESDDEEPMGPMISSISANALLAEFLKNSWV